MANEIIIETQIINNKGDLELTQLYVHFITSEEDLCATDTTKMI